ncbi:AraC family transcriptional regulator [Caballeronia sp. LZ065]|uniref:AraC family transcriptional regulator n=1 Tax=Caballeronia sp. LZ065 TaxID=3038571 RepID=UPI002857E80D|nr:AraC family transcriptional regulator [Caballeronia sp. LZ065]MDR5783991.1 AraC family transcriptional regulator [Caballeronia sp. LZ065]
MPETITLTERFGHLVTTPSPDKRVEHVEPVERDSIAVSLVEAALRCAEARGVARDGLLAAAGIAPAMLASPRARVSPVQYGKLWHAVADALDDEFFGQDAHPMRRGSFVLMCHAALSSRDGTQALTRIADFMRLVLDELRFTPDIDGTRVRIWLDDRGDARTMFAYATGFILVYGLLCWLVGRRIPVLAAHLRCPEPEAGDEYRLMFCEDMRFGAARSFVDLDAGCATLPVVQTRATLKRFLREAPANFIVKYRNPDSLTARIRRHLRETPPADWPEAEPLAAALNMAEATLRRRLKQEGSTYRAIRDALRRDLAIARLAHTRETIPQIADALGFAEPSAFRRAFRKWTGVRPADYRRGR